MKKKFAVAVSALLAASVMVGCAGGGDAGGRARVSFLYTGDGAMGEQFALLIDAYNEGQGKEDNIQIRSAKVADDGYDTKMNTSVYDSNSYDVFCVRDEYFKKYSSFLEPLDGFEGAAELSAQVNENQLSRYRYNIQSNTSNAGDPLYAYPAVNGISVMYYNKTLLEQAGVKCISVEEKDLAAFNAGTLKDGFGKSKSDYGIEASFSVPAKGFYRETPYVKPANETNGASWQSPASGELMIFNDKIAMNWDEAEDVGMVMTKSKNSASPTDYGYYSEWWFAYGWSVGGDCVQDISGNGDWKYTLPDATANYIVQQGTYTGVYSGKVYQKGETLSFLDKLDVNKGDTIVANDDNTFTVNNTNVQIRAEVAQKAAAGELAELPSTKEAFSRFVMLAGADGLNVCPKPSEISSATNFFCSGRLAFCVEYMKYISDIDKAMNQRNNQWSVAPLPVYKTYNPDGTVAVQGKSAAHSLGYGVAINKNSKMKDKAWKFVKWVAGEGQKLLAENGYLSSNIDDAALFAEKTAYPNAPVLLELNSHTQPGDWWYMPDRDWINTWSDPLNGRVRNGTMTIEEFFASYTQETNKALANYKR